MAKLPRIYQKIFGESAGVGEFGKIGSEAAGLPETTKDLDLIQSLAQFAQGLYAITDSADEPPRIQDINALYLLFSSQIAYLMQSGIPEWNSSTEYFDGVSMVIGSDGALYMSIQGTDLAPNLNKPPLTEPTWWRKLIDKTGKAVNTGLVDGTTPGAGGKLLLALSALSSLSPAMNGTAAAGSSNIPSRQDHVHPTDTTRAPLASPALTGTPTAPTATAGTNTTQIATTQFVNTEINNDRPYSDTNPLINGTAAQGSSARVSRQDHVHPTDTTRAPLASPALTGTPTAPTAAASTDTTQIATTAFVKDQLLAAIYPIGCYYTQYPDASSNTDATEFPTAQRPATLFGGTWAEQWATESIYFRTRGTLSDSGRVNGKQEDAFQGHWHQQYGTAQMAAGANVGNRDTVSATTAMAANTVREAISDGVNGTPRTATETRVVNRRIKVWKRTA